VIAIWKRKRLVFLWEGIKVFLDETKGYGKIIELEKITDKKNKEKVYAKLKSKLKSLGIKKITPKEIFEQRFKSYLKKWKK
jgi:adenylate cyclase class IV